MVEMWKRVDAAAARVTPRHLAELVAVKHLSFVPVDRCPTAKRWDPLGKDLVRWKLLFAQPVAGWNKRSYWLLSLTEMGERVLLQLAENALVETGRLSEPEPDEDEGTP